MAYSGFLSQGPDNKKPFHEMGWSGYDMLHYSFIYLNVALTPTDRLPICELGLQIYSSFCTLKWIEKGPSFHLGFYSCKCFSKDSYWTCKPKVTT